MYLNAFLCLGFIKNKTLKSMHKLHHRSQPLDPTGIILKACCNSTGVIQTVCIKIDPHDEEILYLFPISNNAFCDISKLLFNI